MRMPVMDGYETAAAIKARPGGQNVVLIAISANIFNDERAAMLESGCDDIFSKPFLEEDFYEKIREHLKVEYVYDESGVPAISAAGPDDFPLDRIPASLIAEMESAVVRADFDRILELVGEIEKVSSGLAARLSEFAQAFEYEKILGILKQKG
jgi:CheY-like chemotaxis protein